MKKLLFLIILNASFLIPNSFCGAYPEPDLKIQNKNISDEPSRTIDSLLALLKKDNADTNKVTHLNKLSREFINIGSYDSSLFYSNTSLQLAAAILSEGKNQSLKHAAQKRIADSYSNTGIVYWKQGDYSKALDYYFRALKIDKELENKNGIARHFSNIGLVYKEQGDYPKALDHFLKALKMAEELGNKNGIAICLGNIGIVYMQQHDYTKALDYYLKALKMDAELGNKNGIVRHLGNIGVVYWNQASLSQTVHSSNNGQATSKELYSKALDYYFKALKMSEELGYKYDIAMNLSNIGNVYAEQKDYRKAEDYFFKALKMREELGDKDGIARSLGNLGAFYTIIGKFKDAEQYLKRGIALEDSIGAVDLLWQNEENLSQLYDTTGRHKEALIHYKKAVAIRDTIFNKENKKQLVSKEMNYEFDKREAIIKSENEKQQVIAGEENRKQKIIIWLAACGLFLVLLFAGLIFRTLRITRKQKNTIELQKNEVSSQKQELEQSHKNISLLSEIGREITSSLSVEKIIEKTYENINKLMDASVFLIGIYDAKNNQLFVPGAMEKGEKLPAFSYDLEDKNRPAVWSFNNQKEIIMGDFVSEYNIYFPNIPVPKPVSGEFVGALVYIPLIILDKKIGVISVQSFNKNAYTNYHISIVRNLAVYISIALENANIYEEMEKLSIVASNTENTVIICSPDTEMIWANDAFTRTLGYTLEEFKKEKGKTILEVSSNPNIKQVLDECIEKRTGVYYESKNRMRNNEERWFQTTLSPVFKENNELRNIIFIDSDITERKIAEIELSQKNKEITDSINYALRIQQAMLTSEEYITKLLPAEYFIFYQPKDIVSGDFYWAYLTPNPSPNGEGNKRGEVFYLATSDCTGHGVPGAFMSLLNISFLNENVIERNIIEPNKILNEQRREIIKALNPKGTENSKDGMDCVLCKFDFDNLTLTFAAANNPLWIIREKSSEFKVENLKLTENNSTLNTQNFELIEYLPDKMPVGKYDEVDKEFTQQKIQLQQGDIVYTFTDGYADQFGGAKGKKFKYKQLKELLLDIHLLSMAEQKNALEKTINSWKGKLEQVDDILVIGIKI